MLNANHSISCSRNDRSDTDLRVREALAYAAGAAGGLLPADAIISAHDHKGVLLVTWKDKSSMENYRKFINRAWGEWAYECEAHHAVVGIDPLSMPPEPAR